MILRWRMSRWARGNVGLGRCCEIRVAFMIPRNFIETVLLLSNST